MPCDLLCAVGTRSLRYLYVYRTGMEQRGPSYNGGADRGAVAARAGGRLRRGRPAARASLPHAASAGNNYCQISPHLI